MNVTVLLRSAGLQWPPGSARAHSCPAGSMLRIVNMVVNSDARDTVRFEALACRDVSPQDMDGLSVALYSVGDRDGVHDLVPESTRSHSISFRVPKSRLAEGTTYGLSFRSTAGVCSYDVRWVFLRGRLVEKYFRDEETSRRLLPLWCVTLYALASVVVLFIYQYARGCTERYRKRLQEIDEIIQDIQSQAAPEGGSSPR